MKGFILAGALAFSTLAFTTSCTQEGAKTADATLSADSTKNQGTNMQGGMDDNMSNPNMETLPTLAAGLDLMKAEESTLIEAVNKAGLADALNDNSKKYTVFAPNNEAFAKEQKSVDALMAAADSKPLADVLKTHVILGQELMANDLKDGQKLTTMNGQTLTVKKNGTDVMIMDQNGRSAKVLQADIKRSNGVAHQIGTVLLPKM